MGRKGPALAIPYSADVQDRGPGCRQRCGPVRQEEVGCQVVQALWAPRLTVFLEAFGIPRPVERSRRSGRNGRMVRMIIQRALAAKRQHDMGADRAETLHQQPAKLVE